MTLLPHFPCLVVLLAVALLGDATLSLRPPSFIRNCLTGVGFPRQWWWTLIVIKVLAAVGLLIGLRVPGVALAASTGVICYFLCAVVAHVRAGFMGRELWINCLGMLTLAVVTAVTSFVG
ncbi:DoxX family protein [Actinomyces ruminicola]|uniref:DoxX family protein n=1 Tax=Actinomyces ruminicola TaxID=332524 RepID=UPI0011C77862|nr:DoxX family protein [Actinomyces ruminicola]